MTKIPEVVNRIECHRLSAGVAPSHKVRTVEDSVLGAVDRDRQVKGDDSYSKILR